MLVPKYGTCYLLSMQIIAKRALRLFGEKHPHAEVPLRVWFAIVTAAKWTGPADIEAMFGAADFVPDNRVVFDIGGNKYRLVVHVSYTYGRILVKFIGTHKEYDRIKPKSV